MRAIDNNQATGEDSIFRKWVKRHSNGLLFLFSCVMVVFLLFAAEFSLRIMHGASSATSSPRIVKSSLHAFTQRDSTLSYVFKPSCIIPATCRYGDEEVYSAHYTIDDSGWRKTIVPGTGEARINLAAFFGCSFSFGTGLNDGDTIASQFAAAQNDLLPANFGIEGWGPQQMWLLLNAPEFLQKLPTHESGVAIYVFIDDHLARLEGVPRVIVEWDYPLPWLSLENGQVVHSGNFRDRNFIQYYMTRYASKIHLARFLLNKLVPSNSAQKTPDEDAKALLLQLIKESSEKAKASKMEFCVLAYPGCHEAKPVLSLLESNGIKCFDYSELFIGGSLQEGELFFKDQPGSEWGHPKALANKIVAERLYKDLSQTFPALFENRQSTSPQPK